jgi:hypothetical protein
LTVMKQTILAVTLACLVKSALAAGTDQYDVIPNPESLKGITHYGMTIEETVRSFRKGNDILEIVYAKDLSDDNMDKYLLRFYEEFLRRVEERLYSKDLPAKNVRIVISNCKFCKVGYCKTKNQKEVTLTSYRDNVVYRKMSFTHQSILQSNEVTKLAREAVSLLID